MATSHFSRELLPGGRAFYEPIVGRLSRPNRKGWSMGRCPFHSSKSGKSLAVNLNTGGFHCFGCDARGGDVVAFAMKLHGWNFREAAKQLGAWDDSSSFESAYRIEAQSRERRATAERAEAERQLRIEFRDWVHLFEEIIRELAKHIAQLQPGDELDSTIESHITAVRELREAVAAYSLLSFGAAAVRKEFVEHPERRDLIVDEVLLGGFDRDNQAHVVEVTA